MKYLRLRMPFRTAANTSARSRSPPKMLLLAHVSLSSCDESDFSGVPVRLDVSNEVRSNLEGGGPCGSAFTLTVCVSASTVTRETSVLATSAEIEPSAGGTPTTDFGRKRPFN